jgi:phosphoribosylanthranilate isomerase
MKIKICGLTREADIEYANIAAPDYIGFVFAQGRRRVSYETAAYLRERLAGGITPVGVFRNAPLADVAALYRQGVVTVAQLHGDEDATYIADLKRLCAVPVIKAVTVLSGGDAARAGASEADFLLLDSGGGTGLTFDWRLIGRREKPFFLAGGIGLDNIGRALDERPYAVDISSGAETEGVKDGDKMVALVRAVRERDVVRQVAADGDDRHERSGQA